MTKGQALKQLLYDDVTLAKPLHCGSKTFERFPFLRSNALGHRLTHPVRNSTSLAEWLPLAKRVEELVTSFALQHSLCLRFYISPAY